MSATGTQGQRESQARKACAASWRQGERQTAQRQQRRYLFPEEENDEHDHAEREQRQAHADKQTRRRAPVRGRNCTSGNRNKSETVIETLSDARGVERSAPAGNGSRSVNRPREQASERETERKRALTVVGAGDDIARRAFEMQALLCAKSVVTTNMESARSSCCASKTGAKSRGQQASKRQRRGKQAGT